MNIGNILTLRYDPSFNLITKDNNRDGIRNIPPKEILQLRQTVTKERNNIPSSQDLENEIRRLIKNRFEGSKEKRIAIALSSGVDSNVIFSLIRKEFPQTDMECLNVTFDENSSEALRAAQLAESKEAGFHEIHVENPLQDLPMLLSIIKEPRWNVYQYYFIEKARSISNLLFTGDGGDELFAGYTFRYKNFLAAIESLSRPSWEDRIRTYLQCHERDWVPDQEAMFAGTQIKFTWSSIYELIKKYFVSNLDPLEQVLLADYHGKLMYDFIPTNEKFFKHFNISGVAPLLCNQIIDIAMKIPASLKYDFKNNIGKIQLREIIKHNTSGYSTDRNRKIGFGMDLAKFWSRFGKEMVTSNLDKGRIFQDKIINKEWYNKSLARIDENKEEATRYISKMLQLLSLEIWYKLFVTSEMSASSSI
ncbi:MAG TPA: asparagine synthase C-terminal domain-containing protein [Candidatus Bathyarchaeia archaeon]|nr:asparagine synthase C-terminal domain-containing protein [Candidatus Bathyarchaeia archaeon]